MKNQFTPHNLLGLYCRDITRYEVLSRQEEKSLFVRYQRHHDEATKERLILSNLRFVIQEAKRFMAYNFNLMDLVAEGTIGLMKAIDKFDHRKEIHFISYAVWWIRQAIFDYLNRTHSMIYIPSNILKKIRKDDYLQALKNDPKSRIKLTLIRNSFMKVLRFHDPVESDRDDDEFINHIPAESQFSPEKLLQKDHLRSKIELLLGSLDAKERKIIEMRYGLGGFPRKMSLKEISASFKLTKERIRQIQNKALNKLKKLYKVHNLSTFLTEH